MKYPSVPHRPRQFNISDSHKDKTFSKTTQLNTAPSSTPKTPQFNTALSSTPLILYKLYRAIICLRAVLNWGVFSVELRGVWNWAVLGVELRGFWCWTEGFFVLNRGISGLKRSSPLVWNWCVELRGCETNGDPYKCLIVVIHWF